MSEQELDNLIRDALLDAAELDEQSQDSAAGFIPSDRYLRQMRAMCRSPNQWARRKTHSRRKTRPRWKTALQRAAVFCLAVSVSFGCVLAAVSQARAGVMQWVLEKDDHDMVFRFGGTPASDVVPEYIIVDIPDGFKETEKDVFPTAICIIYENGKGDLIGFDYGFMHQGAATIFSIQDARVTSVQVNQHDGYYFEPPSSPDAINTLFWIEPEVGMYFMLNANMGKNDMLSLAGSIRPAEIMK